MAVNPFDEVRGGPTPVTREPLTSVVTKVTGEGVWVAPLGGDHRTPIGPCRGGTGLGVGDPCVLVWTQELPWALAMPTGGGGGGGPVALGDLTDVTTSGATAGHLLGYTGSQWVPTAPPTPPAPGVTELGDLTDVTTAGAADGKVLTYQSGQWAPATPTGGGGAELPPGVEWPPEPGTLATRDALTAGQIQIPSSAINDPGANPSGTGRREASNLVNAASSAYGARSTIIEVTSTIWVEGVSIYSAGGGSVEVSVIDLMGFTRATGTYSDAPSGSPAWHDVTLSDPVQLRSGQPMFFTFTPSVNAPIYRRTNALYSGALWRALGSRTGSPYWFSTGQSYSETIGFGIIEYS